MEIGDLATWVGAIGTLVVAALALYPIARTFTAHRSRGRLVAATLFTPVAQVTADITVGMTDLAKMASATDASAANALKATVERLKRMSESVPQNLGVYDLADAAYLPGQVGLALAQGIGAANAAAAQLGRFIDVFEERLSLNAQQVAPRLLIEGAHAVAEPKFLFGLALSRLNYFLDYCERTFSGGPLQRSARE